MITMFVLGVLSSDATMLDSKILIKARAQVVRNGSRKIILLNVIDGNKNISAKQLPLLRAGSKHLMNIRVNDIGLTPNDTPCILASLHSIIMIGDAKKKKAAIKI